MLAIDTKDKLTDGFPPEETSKMTGNDELAPPLNLETVGFIHLDKCSFYNGQQDDESRFRCVTFFSVSRVNFVRIVL